MHKWNPKLQTPSGTADGGLGTSRHRFLRFMRGEPNATYRRAENETGRSADFGTPLETALRHARLRAGAIRRSTAGDAPLILPDEINLFRLRGCGLDFEFASQAARASGISLGEGVTVAHFEEGWHLDHPYLHAAQSNERPFERIGDDELERGRADHGTAVLGMHIGGIRGVPGLRPLIPGANILLVQAKDEEGVSPADVLARAVDRLARSKPAVLLIARDWSSRVPHLPYELRGDIAGVLAEARTRGIVVVESAGNGGVNLDHLVKRDGDHVKSQITMHSDRWLHEHDLLSPAFHIDTGAMIVGACTSTHPLERWTSGFASNPQPRSNYGSRVDCCAPGEDIFTATGAVAGGLPQYTSSFGGTSAAAAIIAAAVAAVQSIAITRTPNASPLPVDEIRTLFRDPQLGTPVLSRGDPIGSMPDLRIILHEAFGSDSSPLGS